MKKIKFKTVPDTNIILAAQYGNPQSPNREYFNRWHNDEFDLIYSDDTLSEYLEKMLEFNISEKEIKKLLKYIIKFGRFTEIKYYHVSNYPQDEDDVAFVLYAVNGEASHLISYDNHLLEL